MHPEQTLSEYLTTWLADYAKPNVTGKTYERYERIVEHNIKPNLGHLRLCDLKPLQIQSFYTLLLREGRKKGGRAFTAYGSTRPPVAEEGAAPGGALGDPRSQPC